MQVVKVCQTHQGIRSFDHRCETVQRRGADNKIRANLTTRGFEPFDPTILHADRGDRAVAPYSESPGQLSEAVRDYSRSSMA